MCDEGKIPTELDEVGQENVEALVSHLSSLKRDLIVYCGELTDRGAEMVRSSIPEERSSGVLLLLTTYGGDAHSAYRIGRCVSRCYDEIDVFVPRWCKSAGTLLAFIGHELVIADDGELGPLDVQVRKPEEGVFENTSTLEVPQAVDFLTAEALKAFREFLVDVRLGGRVTTRMAADIAATLATGLFGPIFAQIDPLRLGELQRSLSISRNYGERLGKHSLKPGALNTLIGDYPAHGFVIDREEAMALFHNVRAPNEHELGVAEAVGEKAQVVERGKPYVWWLPAEDIMRKAQNASSSDDKPVGATVAGPAVAGDSPKEVTDGNPAGEASNTDTEIEPDQRPRRQKLTG